ncbi:MAG TPA: glycogen synthase GlgA [Candidatus Methylomirabilis sp.]|nr:glycogen synthase GlgA [Candidatus Methylomirabilis sp.]
MKVLFVASECSPFAKTGGLGEVIGALPKALSDAGVDVRVVMPLYAGMPWREFEPLEGVLSVPMWFGMAHARIRLGHLPGSRVPVYCLEHHRYFDRPHLYGPPSDAYPDNLERFAFLSRGALELTKAVGFIPDVVHAHDWQAALAPVYADTVEWGQPLHGSATIYTIHNLAYQGVYESGAMFVTGLGPEHYHAREFEHFGTLNLTKAALYRSTLLTTVSRNYAREIQTPALGCGLDGVLAERGSDLSGVTNGIDVAEWNPAGDPRLAAHFDADDLAGKAECKAALQREAGLPVRPTVPVLALVTRLTAQKGTDVVAHALEKILSWDVQLVILGSGDPEAERFFTAQARARPDRFCAWIPFDDARAHRIQAGADFFVMPSRFEPCGLGQLYAKRYGTLPIVRATGGLVDTVTGYDEATGGGTGFVFHDLDPGSLADTIGWAVSTWYDRPAHIAAMRRQAMRADHSWDRAAREYLQLYLAAYARRRGEPFVATAPDQRPEPNGGDPGEVPRPAPAETAGAKPRDRAGRRASRARNEPRRERRRPTRRASRG